MTSLEGSPCIIKRNIIEDLLKQDGELSSLCSNAEIAIRESTMTEVSPSTVLDAIKSSLEADPNDSRWPMALSIAGVKLLESDGANRLSSAQLFDRSLERSEWRIGRRELCLANMMRANVEFGLLEGNIGEAINCINGWEAEFASDCDLSDYIRIGSIFGAQGSTPYSRIAEIFGEDPDLRGFTDKELAGAVLKQLGRIGSARELSRSELISGGSSLAPERFPVTSEGLKEIEISLRSIASGQVANIHQVIDNARLSDSTAAQSGEALRVASAAKLKAEFHIDSSTGSTRLDNLVRQGFHNSYIPGALKAEVFSVISRLGEGDYQAKGSLEIGNGIGRFVKSVEVERDATALWVHSAPENMVRSKWDAFNRDLKELSKIAETLRSGGSSGSPLSFSELRDLLKAPSTSDSLFSRLGRWLSSAWS